MLANTFLHYGSSFMNNIFDDFDYKQAVDWSRPGNHPN
jgi:hypothetical protein